MGPPGLPVRVLGEEVHVGNCELFASLAISCKSIKFVQELVKYGEFMKDIYAKDIC